jgi:hypothetical protein
LCGYLPIDLSTTITESDQSIPINQIRAPSIPLTNPGALSITVTNHGASPVTWNGKQYSITIQDTTGTYTASQIVNYIHWNISQIGYWNGFRALSWPTMVIPNSTSFETSYGTLYGSAGATLKGVRVVGADGTTAVAGFTQMQSDDGTYYTPPVSATFTLSNLQANSSIVLMNTSQNVLANVTNSNNTFSYTYTWTSDIPLIVSIVSLGYQDIYSTAYTLTSSNQTIPITQIIDRQYYNPTS